jgi:putative beta-lysine N-acetyltransferase
VSGETTVEEVLGRLLGGAPNSALRRFTIDTAGGIRAAILDPHNARLKLYGLTPAEFEGSEIARARASVELVSKLVVYALPADPAGWRDLGFRCEGVVRGFFRDGTDAVLQATYPDPVRARVPREAELDAVVEAARSRPREEPILPEGYSTRIAEPADAPAVAELLQRTFSDYPSPLDTDHVRALIDAGSSRFGLVATPDGSLAAVASAEIDAENRSAEMTDCATEPAHRGRGLMAALLRRIEEDVSRDPGIRDFYTLARAEEVGMNCVFAKLGYDYTGRLGNNCRMPGGWESMNVWCRTTAAEPVP